MKTNNMSAKEIANFINSIDIIKDMSYDNHMINVTYEDGSVISIDLSQTVNNIYHGDCIDILLGLNNTVDLTFTSPPYFNAKEYSQYMTYNEYLTTMSHVFTGVHRVTKEGGFLVINISPVIEPRISRAHQSKRYPIPMDLTYNLTRNGWIFIEDIIWEKPEPSVKNRNGGFMQHRKPLAYKPNIVHEYLLVFRKQTEKLIDWNIKHYAKEIVEDSKVKDGYEKTSIWKIQPKSSKHHPAIFPEELAEKVISYYSMVGDIVLDPFSGIGTTCKVAKKLYRNYIGIEINKDYYEYSLKNVENG